jgi:hypothetical protein
MGKQKRTPSGQRDKLRLSPLYLAIWIYARGLGQRAFFCVTIGADGFFPWQDVLEKACRYDLRR